MIRCRVLLLLVLAAFVLCLLPLLYLGRYNVPCADDYNYGAAAHQVLLRGGGARELAAAVLRRTYDTYFGWQGSYSAVLLMCLQPAVFSESLYALTPWLMFSSLFAGLFCCCIALLRRVFDLPASVGGILAGLLGILYLLLVPSPVQSFYWYNGAVYYTFFHGIALLTVALAIRTAGKGGWGRILLLCLLAVFLGGGNLVTGLSLAILALSVPLLLLLEKKRAEAGRLLLPCLVMLVCFCVNALAPGNQVRQGNVDYVPQVIPAILGSFRLAAVYGLRWLRLPVLGVLLVLGLVFHAVLPGSRFSFRFPGLVSLYSLCLYAAMYCPTMYALGDRGDWRLMDIIYYAYLLLLALNLLYWQGWQQARRGARRAGDPALLPILGSLLLCVALLGVSARLQGGISLASAYSALRGGQARAYYATAQERLAILRDPEISVALLPDYRDPPYLLFFDDISADPNDWRNMGMASFYEKDQVILLESAD